MDEPTTKLVITIQWVHENNTRIEPICTNSDKIPDEIVRMIHRRNILGDSDSARQP